MRNLVLTGLLATVLAGSSGCCVVDRLFQCRPCGLLSGCGSCGGCCGPLGCSGYDAHAGCDSCGGEGCESCNGGGCDACGGGNCNSWDYAGGYSDGCYRTYGAHTPGGCKACGMAKNGPSADDQLYEPPGPPMGAVTYPYYTTRGPRDFLARNPASIGP